MTSCSWSSRSSRWVAPWSGPAVSSGTPPCGGRAVRGVLAAASQAGLGTVAVTASPLPGPAGNVEYFVWLRPSSTGDATADGALDGLVERAVAAGPA